VEKARTFVSVWVQRYPLFQKPVKIDFKDGSATPKEAYAFVQCRVAKNPNPDPTAADPDDPKAPYKMIYGAKDVKGETIALVENAVRSYLNGLTIDEGLPGGRGGYNILERLPEGDRNGVKGQLSNFGLRLLRITIGDFDLDRTVIDARESVMRAEKGAVAAEREMAKYSNSAMGVLIQMLADAQGMKREEIQKQIKKNSKLRKQLLEIARDLVERKIAIEGKGFSDIRVAEAGGMEKTLLELIALWQSGASPKEKPTGTPDGRKNQKKEQDGGSGEDQT